ncbi:MAG: OmpA family protein [Porphyromonas sp.]|nr:OmpA family protein [Porphyromonas sp.]
MKLQLTVLALAGAMALSANAQESAARMTQVSYEKSTPNNWFITFQGGASILANGDNSKAKFSERLTFTPSLAVGKWHSPYYATRLKAEVGEAKSFYNSTSLLKHENYFVGAHYDFMLDLVNLFSRYGQKNVISLVPFVGLGYEYKFDSSERFHDVHAATANVGLQLGIRLGERVDFVLEGQSSWNGIEIRNSFPREYNDTQRLSASAGLNFRLGKIGFTAVTPLDEALVANLNGQINALRAENAELAKRPVDCPEVVAAPAVATASHFLADKSILFAHGKSAVSKDQLITVFDASEFVKKYDGELVITGYTQKSESRFAGLAEKRAQAVARILTEEYGVPSEKITIEYKDASEGLFDGKNTAWNRSVVIRSK